MTQPFHFNSTAALYRYEFPVDRLVHGLKYGGQLSLARWFGLQLAETLNGSSFDQVIPMPLHPTRLQERGFNQSAEIARVVSRALDIPLDLESCRRTRLTIPQAELPLAERVGNVRGVFECVADLSGRRLLLVDDVMTSGATLNECARTLRLYGAASVSVGVIARALRN